MGAYDGSADDIIAGGYTAASLGAEIESIKQSTGHTTGGSSNAYTIVASPVCDSYEEGQVFWAELNHTNTGAATMEWVSSTPKTLTDQRDNAFAGGELISGAIHKFYYDGTNVRCLTAIARQTWTPTYSAGGSMTVNSPTTNSAYFYEIGNLVYFHLNCSGSFGGSADNDFFVDTIPKTAAAAAERGGCVQANTSAQSGVWIMNTTSQILIRNYDNTNWSLSSYNIVLQGFYRAA